MLQRHRQNVRRYTAPVTCLWAEGGKTEEPPATPTFQRETSEKTQATWNKPRACKSLKASCGCQGDSISFSRWVSKEKSHFMYDTKDKTGEDLERKPIIRNWRKVKQSQSPKRQLWKAWGQILTSWSSSALAMECTEKDKPDLGAKSRTYILIITLASGMSYHSPEPK